LREEVRRMPVIVLSILMVVAMAVTIYGSAFLSLRVTLFGLGITVAFSLTISMYVSSYIVAICVIPVTAIISMFGWECSSFLQDLETRGS